MESRVCLRGPAGAVGSSLCGHLFHEIVCSDVAMHLNIPGGYS